ncbi:hypothetical protein ANO11243_092350 [Dothideomycetidae sp. 11243]|nr:hypothetical protein ANO11243_092350 [fungal sp. No.11243]
MSATEAGKAAAKVCKTWQSECRHIYDRERVHKINLLEELSEEELRELSPKVRHLLLSAGDTHTNGHDLFELFQKFSFPSLCTLRLDVPSSRFLDDDPGFIKSTQLKCLVLEWFEVNEISWESWTNHFAGLEELSLQIGGLEPFDDDEERNAHFAQFLDRHSRLISLKIDHCRRTDELVGPLSLACLAQSGSLRVLHLLSTTYEIEVITNIDDTFPCLEELVLVGECTSLERMVRQSHQLLRLDLRLIDWDQDILSSIAILRKLTYLRIAPVNTHVTGSVDLSPHWFSIFSSLNRLECLCITADIYRGQQDKATRGLSTDWSMSEQVEFFSSFPRLRHLVISGVGSISQSAFCTLGRTATNLQFCHLTMAFDVSSAQLEQLPVFNSLEHLRVERISQSGTADREVHNKLARALRSRMPNLEALLVSDERECHMTLMVPLAEQMTRLSGSTWLSCKHQKDITSGYDCGIALLPRTLTTASSTSSTPDPMETLFLNSMKHDRYRFMAPSAWLPAEDTKWLYGNKY